MEFFANFFIISLTHQKGPTMFIWTDALRVLSIMVGKFAELTLHPQSESTFGACLLATAMPLHAHKNQ